MTLRNTGKVPEIDLHLSLFLHQHNRQYYSRWTHLLLECNKILGVRLSVIEHHKGCWRWWIISNGIEPIWRFLQTTPTCCIFAGENTSLIYILQTRGVGWTVSSDRVGSWSGKIHSIADSKSLNNKYNTTVIAMFTRYFQIVT